MKKIGNEKLMNNNFEVWDAENVDLKTCLTYLKNHYSSLNYFNKKHVKLVNIVFHPKKIYSLNGININIVIDIDNKIINCDYIERQGRYRIILYNNKLEKIAINIRKSGIGNGYGYGYTCSNSLPEYIFTDIGECGIERLKKTSNYTFILQNNFVKLTLPDNVKKMKIERLDFELPNVLQHIETLEVHMVYLEIIKLIDMTFLPKLKNLTIIFNTKKGASFRLGNIFKNIDFLKDKLQFFTIAKINHMASKDDFFSAFSKFEKLEKIKFISHYPKKVNMYPLSLKCIQITDVNSEIKLLPINLSSLCLEKCKVKGDFYLPPKIKGLEVNYAHFLNGLTIPNKLNYLKIYGNNEQYNKIDIPQNFEYRTVKTNFLIKNIKGRINKFKYYAHGITKDFDLDKIKVKQYQINVYYGQSSKIVMRGDYKYHIINIC